MNNNKIILDLCGGTGSWSKPYKEAGYDVKVITLPEFNVTDVFIDLNTVVFRNQTGGEDIEVKVHDVYGIFAAPPCTQFSLARTTAKTPRDLRGGVEVMSGCLRIVWECQYNGDKLAFWAMENPRALMRRFLGMSPFSFEHWEFGDPSIKPTDVWGKFALPKKTVLKRPAGLSRSYPCGSSMSVNWNPRRMPGLSAADMRAITPQGFAQAFYKANK